MREPLETINSPDTSVHNIQISTSGASFNAIPSQSLLVCMEKAGLSDIQVGCRGGGCGQCRIQVLEGKFEKKRMSRAHIQPEDENKDIVLACRIFATSDLVIIPLPPANTQALPTTAISTAFMPHNK